MTHLPSALIRNAAGGLALGMFIATGLAAWITFIRGAVGTEPFDRLGNSYGATLALYYAGAGIGGTVVGALRPLGRRPLGAACLGIIGVFPLYFGVAASQGETLVTRSNAIGSLLPAFLVGASLGIWVWLDNNPNQNTWLDALRKPSATTLNSVWIVCPLVAAASYFGLSRFTGSWPVDLTILCVALLFVLPCLLCVLVTRAWLATRSR